MPLTGGLAILLSLIAAISLSDITASDLGMGAFFWLTLAGLLALVVLAHAIDDILELHAVTRLLIDGTLAWLIATVAAIKIVTLGDLFGMGDVNLGRYAVPMTIFSFIAASNAFNMTDGIDSHCTGFGLIAFGTLIVLLAIGGDPGAMPLIKVLAIITLALVPMYLANIGTLGPRLRSFLGDSGARLIGFMAAIAVIMAASKGFIDPVFAFFPIAVPICDCLILATVRTANGRSPIAADRRHFHHLLIDNGLTPCQARRVSIWTGIGIAGVGVSLQATGSPEVIVSIAVISLMTAFITVRTLLALKAQPTLTQAEIVSVQQAMSPKPTAVTQRRPKAVIASEKEEKMRGIAAGGGGG